MSRKNRRITKAQIARQQIKRVPRPYFSEDERLACLEALQTSLPSWLQETMFPYPVNLEFLKRKAEMTLEFAARYRIHVPGSLLAKLKDELGVEPPAAAKELSSG